MNKYFATATATAIETLTIKKRLCQFQLGRGQWFIANRFYNIDYSILSLHSPITCVKHNRKTQQWFMPNALNYTQIRQRRYNQQLLPRKFSPPKRLKIPSYCRNNKLFTTTITASRKSGRHRRKKKPLLPLSNEKFTTKDRLRLSSRPSSSVVNSRRNENNIERMMIKSPEELMERLSWGLDTVRAAVQESYASLRNPTVATSSGNVGNKHDNHLLPARPSSSGTNQVTKRLHEKGLVMDDNWWFWNILLAASPSAVIALYCEFIVKPEMEIRNEEKENHAASDGKEMTNGSFSEETDDQRSGDSVNKMSPMRKRQEQQKHHRQQQLDSTTSENAPSLLPLNSSRDFNKMLSSYIRPLISWFSEQQSLPTPSSEHGRSREAETDEIEKSSITIDPNANQEQQGIERRKLEMQQKDLREIQLQLQILKDKVNRQQQQRADLNAGIDCYDSDGSDVLSENSTKRGSLLSSIGEITKSTTSIGIAIGRERWASMLYWWQSRGHRRQSSDGRSCGGDGDGGVIPTNHGAIIHGKQKIEKPFNAMQTDPTE